jgi:hypothetical protein
MRAAAEYSVNLKKIKKKLSGATLAELGELQDWIGEGRAVLWDKRDLARREKAWKEVRERGVRSIRVRSKATLHVRSRPAESADADPRYRILHFRAQETCRIKRVDEKNRHVWLYVGNEIACLDLSDLVSLHPLAEPNKKKR